MSPDLYVSLTAAVCAWELALREQERVADLWLETDATAEAAFGRAFGRACLAREAAEGALRRAASAALYQERATAGTISPNGVAS